jgi:hypothetical protein
MKVAHIKTGGESLDNMSMDKINAMAQGLDSDEKRDKLGIPYCVITLVPISFDLSKIEGEDYRFSPAIDNAYGQPYERCLPPGTVFMTCYLGGQFTLENHS